MKGMREEAVTTVVEQSLRELEFTQAEKEYLAKRIKVLKAGWFEEKEKQLGNLNVTLQHVSDRLNRLTDAYLDGTIEKEIYEERKAALLFERRAIEDRLNDLKTGKTSIPEIPRTRRRRVFIVQNADHGEKASTPQNSHLELLCRSRKP
jgi:chromosome segregation ATPase